MNSSAIRSCVYPSGTLLAAVRRQTTNGPSFAHFPQPIVCLNSARSPRYHPSGVRQTRKARKTASGMAAVEGRTALTGPDASVDNPKVSSAEDAKPKRPGSNENETPVIFDRASDRELSSVEGFPGVHFKAFRPTSMLFKFSAGFIEPAHHHTLTHDEYLISGHKIMQNVTRGTTLELKAGDYLSTPGGDVHRVLYLTDSELFAKFDGTDAMALPGNNKMEMIESPDVAKEAFGDWIDRVEAK